MSLKQTALVLFTSCLALPLVSSAAGVRGETVSEEAVRKVSAQLVKDLKFSTKRVDQVCGTDKPGTAVIVQVEVAPGKLETVKVYGVLNRTVFSASKVVECK